MEPTDNTHVRYYYVRSNTTPVACVCLIRSDDNRFCRGVSICNESKGDKFLRKVARGIAFARAKKAYEEMSSGNMDKTLNSEFEVFGFDLEIKLRFIAEQMGLSEFPKKMDANVSLTDSEKEMWRDHLDPSFVKKPREVV